MQKSYILDKAQKNIQVDFIIQQVRVINTSQSTVYVNFSGQVPTTQKYDMIVAPNTIIASPKTNTSILTILSANLINGDKLVELIVDTDETLTPSNIENPTDYFVPVPPYPVTISSGANSFQPTFVLNKVMPTFIELSPTSSVATPEFPACGLLTTPNVGFGGSRFIGVVGGFGGMVQFLPPQVPYIAGLATLWSDFAAQTYILNVFQANVQIAHSDFYSNTNFSLTTLQQKIFNYGINGTGFIFSLEGLNSTPNGCNISVSIRCANGSKSNTHDPYILNRQVVLTGITNLNVVYVVKPKVFYVSHPQVVYVSVTNNSAQTFNGHIKLQEF